MNVNNNTYMEKNMTTLPPSNINSIKSIKRAININTNGDSSGDEELVYPSSNYDKCKSAPLKI